MVIRANLSSDGSEEAEMKAEHQPRLKPKAENVVKKESRVFFSLTSLGPRGERCISRVAEQSRGVTTVFFFFPLSQQCAITGRQP